MIRPWLLAVLLVLALASGLALDRFVLSGRRIREPEERHLLEMARRDAEIADLLRRLEEAERRAQMEAEQRRIAEDVIRREKLWK